MNLKHALILTTSLAACPMYGQASLCNGGFENGLSCWGSLTEEFGYKDVLSSYTDGRGITFTATEGDSFVNFWGNNDLAQGFSWATGDQLSFDWAMAAGTNPSVSGVSLFAGLFDGLSLIETFSLSATDSASFNSFSYTFTEDSPASGALVFQARGIQPIFGVTDAEVGHILIDNVRLIPASGQEPETATPELVYVALNPPCQIVNTRGSGLPFNLDRTEQSFMAWGEGGQLNPQRDSDGGDGLNDCLPEVDQQPVAMAANITVAAKTFEAKGNLVAFPQGSDAPATSLINFQANNIANSSIISLNPEGDTHFTVQTHLISHNPGGAKQVNVIIDALGYFYPRAALATTTNSGLSYIPLAQACRIVNTGRSDKTFDDSSQKQQGFLAWGSALVLDGQRDGDGSKNLGACLPETGMKPAAIMANVTVAAKRFSSKGNLVAFQHNTTPPTASLVNFSANNVANASIISLAPDAEQHFDIEARIFNHLSGGTRQVDVLVDAQGYFYSQHELDAAGKSGLHYAPLVQACRIVDTRGVNQAFNETNRATQGFSAWGTVAELNLQRDEDGSDALSACQPAEGKMPAAMMANVTVVAKGFKSKGNLVVYPAGSETPASSTINFQANTIANSSVITLSGNDDAPHFNIGAQIFGNNEGGSKQVHVIVDVLGYFYP